MKPTGRAAARIWRLVLALSLALWCDAGLAQSARAWPGDELRGIHYAVERNSLLPDRWRAELQHTDDCQAPCTVEFDDRISAVHLRYGWMQLNPAKGDYNFDDLGAVLDIIHAAGKKATLVVMAGKYTPPWIFDKGAAHLQMQFRHVDAYSQHEVPVPWDPVFVAAHGEMIAALSDFLRQTPARYETLALVKNGALTSHSGETRLMPHMAFMKRAEKHDEAKEDAVRKQLCTEFAQAGYSEEKILDTARAVNAQIAQAFPDQYLGLAFVAGSKRFPTVKAGKCTYPKKNDTLNTIIKDMVATYGPRAIPDSTVLTAKIGNPRILDWVKSQGGQIGFQLNAQETGCRKAAAPCSEKAVVDALGAGLAAGAVYIEVHDGNIHLHRDILKDVNRAMTVR
jgi:hypothetical protein